MPNLPGNFRYALRQFRWSPVFTAAAVLTLALGMIGRLRPGASIDGMAPRLTGVLRQWMQNDSGYPSNWMPDVIRVLPKQVIGFVLLIACSNVALPVFAVDPTSPVSAFIRTVATYASWKPCAASAAVG